MATLRNATLRNTAAQNVPDYGKKIEKANNLQKKSVANFWQVGVYKRVVKRVDDGASLLDDYTRMVLERAQIEKKYAAMLSAFAKKWEDKIDKGPEEPEGTLKPAWNALLTEATSLSEVHAETDLRLKGEVVKDVLNWKKNNYKKQMRHWKVTKQNNDKFTKAQKPWAKALKDMKRSQKVYYSCCENLNSLEAKVKQLRRENAPVEDIAKVEAKVNKAIQAKADAKQIYMSAVHVLEADHGRYKTEMTEVFQSCQDLEQRRQDFMKTEMGQYSRILARHTPTQCTHMQEVVEAINPDADIVTYHKTRGAGMPLPVPGFEEFGAKPTIEVVVNSPTESGTVPPHMQLVDLTVAQNGGVDAADDDEDEFDEDWDGNDWEAPPSTAVDNSVSIKVRALYDYHAEDPEELSLTAGDIVAQIEDEDDQGWCKGVHLGNGRTGIYPALYCEPLEGDATPATTDVASKVEPAIEEEEEEDGDDDDDSDQEAGEPVYHNTRNLQLAQDADEANDHDDGAYEV
eukprot:TRINITY_DN12185_c0_g6_i1.p1 TRINITY_DN12185_c0_g6~~TRINITY_DN12185_c0_g6_i1.p1  ORF type:complete len:514 (+),score=176.82 TRINITY_DN12185_c0_g6_i1:146-1687(+)